MKINKSLTHHVTISKRRRIGKGTNRISVSSLWTHERRITTMYSGKIFTSSSILWPFLLCRATEECKTKQESSHSLLFYCRLQAFHFFLFWTQPTKKRRRRQQQQQQTSPILRNSLSLLVARPETVFQGKKFYLKVQKFTCQQYNNAQYRISTQSKERLMQYTENVTYRSRLCSRPVWLQTKNQLMLNTYHLRWI